MFARALQTHRESILKQICLFGAYIKLKKRVYVKGCWEEDNRKIGRGRVCLDKTSI